MSKVIHAHEATLKTASVDVRTLTVSGRQVTLSVFRQLKDEDLVNNETLELNGIPWGTVNYFWKDCHRWDRKHLHVVWEKNGELRRSAVYPNPEGETFEGMKYEFRLLHSMAVYLNLVEKNEAWSHVLDTEKLAYSDPLFQREWGVPSFDHLHWQDRLAAQDRLKTLDGLLNAYREFWPDALHDETTFQATHERLERDLTTYAHTWKRQYQSLADLDQLFIAV